MDSPQLAYLQRCLNNTPGATIDTVRGTVSLWVVNANGAQHVFNRLDDAQAFVGAWNETHYADEAAAVRSVSFVASDLYKAREHCRMVALELPRELIGLLIDRCQELQASPHKLIAGLLLHSLKSQARHVKQTVAALETWEIEKYEFSIPTLLAKRQISEMALRRIENERQSRETMRREVRLRFIKDQECRTCGHHLTLEFERRNQAVLFQDGLQCAWCKSHGMVAPGISSWSDEQRLKQHDRIKGRAIERRRGVFATAARDGCNVS